MKITTEHLLISALLELHVPGVLEYSLRLRDTKRGCGFPSTSTCSSSCTVDLPELKMTQYEASDTGKHCKSREIHNLRGRVLTEAATTRFFSSEI